MTTLLADAAAADPYHHGLSLLRGWLPIVIQLVTAAILLAAVGWRTRRWRLLWLPLAVMIGVAAAAWANWFIDSQGMADDPAPDELWVWIGLSGLAIGVAVFGFASAAWWRRGVSVLAVGACLLSTALAVNFWVGYFPTVQTAWNQLTAGPLPDEKPIWPPCRRRRRATPCPRTARWCR